MPTAPSFNSTIIRDTLSIDTVSNDTQDRFGKDHTMPIRYITINNKDFRREKIIDNVSYLKVVERADGLSTAEIHIFNEDYRYTNDPFFKHQNIVQIWTGYNSPSGRSIEKRGSFRINEIKARFDQGQKSKLVLFCVSPEYDLMFREERVIWEKRTDYDIALEIAKKHKFGFVGRRTDVTYTKVPQILESDMKFLEKRAKFYGYDVYVDEFFIYNGKQVRADKPVLHFHEPIFFEDVLGPIHYGGQDPRTAVKFFEVSFDSWFRNVEYRGTQFDPLSKEFIDEKSSDEDGIDFQKKMQSEDFDHVDLVNATSIEDKRPVRYLKSEGHIRNREEVKRQVQKFSEFSRYAVQGCGSIIGLEQFKKRKMVYIAGIGRFSGNYYITKAVHEISGKKGYRLDFDVIKISPGEHTQRGFGDRTELESALDTNEDFSSGLRNELNLESTVVEPSAGGPGNFQVT